MQKFSLPQFKMKYPGEARGAILPSATCCSACAQRGKHLKAASFYGDSPRSVQYWVQRLLNQELAGLWDKEHSGRPRQLSVSVRKKLRKEIGRSPRELGYEQNLWDGALLSYHLKEQYSINLGIRQCQRLFHKLGFTLQRPHQRAQEADPIAQEDFKKLQTVNERPYYSTMGRRRSPFSKAQQCPIFLPPYSSEFNPIERVWRITRRQVTHNRYFEFVEILEKSLMSHFNKWNRPNNTLRVLCANI